MWKVEGDSGGLAGIPQNRRQVFQAYTRPEGSRVVGQKVFPFITEKADGGIVVIWETGRKEKLCGDETSTKGTLFEKQK